MALERMIVALPQYQDGAPVQPQEGRGGDATNELGSAQSERRARYRQIMIVCRWLVIFSIHEHTRLVARGKREFNPYLEKVGFRHVLLDYNYFWAFQLLIPFMREKRIEWFRREYEKCVAGLKIRPSIIAHSFGTYIVASALLKYQEIAFDRLILCGSIVRRGYDWSRVLNSGQGNAVLNEYSVRDIWVKLPQLAVADAGASGAYGFDSSEPALYQRPRPEFRHSDYFSPLNYEKNWIPFLRGVEPEEYASERQVRRNPWLRFRPAKRN